jgi:hypothetical protein
MQHTINSGIRNPRIRRLSPVTSALGFAALVVSAIVGCSSSSSGSHGDACKLYPGQCGKKCTTDADCAQGLYCGPQGACTADCAKNGPSCANGGTCSSTGRCSTGDTTMFGGGGGDLTDASACVNDRRRGEGIPADIFIMNDQSLSMSCSIPTGGDRWDAMKNAITTFVNSQAATGLGVGIQYFGILQGFGDTRGTCNASVYENPDVEIGALPGNAQAIVQSLNRHGPSTYTPTPAALQGAIAHAKAWATAHPSHLTSVVLATDGEPNLCGTTGDIVGDVANIAAAGFNGNPKIPTYVIGIIGGSAANGGRGCNLDPAPPNKPDLDRVAQAGGTKSAFIVDAANGDTAAQFLDALNAIRGSAVIPCQYVLPPSEPGKEIDPGKVNVTYTPSSGSAQPLLQAPSQAQCPASGGWYYDDPATPTKILLCPATCSVVSADPKGQVDVLLGCKTEVVVQ